MSVLIEIASCVREDSNQFFDAFGIDAEPMFAALLAAEDRRGGLHNGIDWLSLLRAAAYSLLGHKFRGVSTIEQQYIRTIRPRRGWLVACKVREFFLSFYIAIRFKKSAIWGAYLWRAYYGHGMVGLPAAMRILFSKSKTIDIYAGAEIVACLKYPRPQVPTLEWQRRHRRRVNYTLAYLMNSKSLRQLRVESHLPIRESAHHTGANLRLE